MSWIFTGLIAPAVVSLIVGVSAGYVTVYASLSRQAEQIAQNAEQLEKFEDVSSRLTAIETKIDLLLDDKLQIGGRDGAA